MNLRVRPRVKLRKFKDRFHYQLSGFTSFLAGRTIRKLNLLLLSLLLSSLQLVYFFKNRHQTFACAGFAKTVLLILVGRAF